MRTANKFHATRTHQRMRRPCCQGSESAYPFQSDAAKTTKPKASADTSSTLPEFEMWRSTGAGSGTWSAARRLPTSRPETRSTPWRSARTASSSRAAAGRARCDCGMWTVAPGKGCHRHRFHHLRMGQEWPSAQTAGPWLAGASTTGFGSGTPRWQRPFAEHVGAPCSALKYPFH